MKNVKYFILFAVTMLSLAFSACNRDVLFVDDRRVDVKGWQLGDKLDFQVEVKDTTQLYTFLVDLRHTMDYPYSNVFFFITTTFPDGGIAADTVECPVATPEGQWLGKSTGGYVENRFIFRKNTRFPGTGVYHFEIQHGMRDTAIVGIKNVGLRIEKTMP